MPTYEYECEGCRRTYEIRQRISDPPLTACRECGGPIRRLLSPAGFILKGSGFYVNDYPSESRKKAAEAEKKGSDTKEASAAPAPAPKSSESPAP
ncbi:MAG: zinc ribbon domain-containing protein [Candidatus Rokubacteria bacterium]|nr:zinc ribbon domain-containing protein [Candidatus Rokubacteria bacterium]